MRKFLKITIINLTAFTIISLVNLLIVPLLVKHYGLAQYGLIVLARMILPTGALALFDFGLTDATTKHVAHAMAIRDRGGAGRAIGTSLLIVVPVTLLLTSVALTAPDAVATYLLGIKQEEFGFLPVVTWTGLALILLFPGLIAEGALRGVERFDLIRGLDVGAGFVYVGGAIALMLVGADYKSIIYLYLASVTARALVLIAVVFVPRSPLWLPLGWPRAGEIGEQVTLAWRLFQGKILSIIFNLGGPLIISHTLSQAAVGIFDALSRIPHFAKSVMGVVNSAILPMAVRMDVRKERAQFGDLLSIATRLSLVFAAVPLATIAMFGSEVFNLWLGGRHAGYGPWFGILMLWPLTLAVSGTGVATLVAQSAAMRPLNLIAVVQVALYIAIGVGFLAQLQERSFVLALVVAPCFVTPLQLMLVIRTYNLPSRLYPDMLVRFALAMIPAVVIAISFRQFGGNSFVTVMALLSALVASGSAAVILLFRRDELAKSFQLVGEFRRRFIS